MGLKVRRILAIIFVLAFFIITPIVILYAAGYKLGKTGLKLEKTGMLVFDSKPSGAKIYIDGKIQKTFLGNLNPLTEENYITTPAKIKNLLPGEYDIKISLDGYWDWQKKLTVNSGSANFAENIILFKKDLPIILQPDVQTAELSPDKNNLAILSGSNLFIYNLSDDAIGQSFTGVEKNKNTLSWSAEGTALLCDNTIFNLNTSERINLNNYFKNAKNIKWDASDDKILHFQNNKNIYSFDSSSKKISTLIENKNINDYLIKNGVAFLISSLNGKINLDIYDTENGQLIRSISLPYAEKYSFINQTEKYLNIINENRGALYIIDYTSNSPLLATISDVKYSNWVNSDRLLYANDYEIWFYNFSGNKQTIITRISNPIKKIISYTGDNYIIFSTENAINTIELDEREKRNITELIKLDEINSPVINRDGDILYFLGKIGNQQGIYKLNIQ